MVAWLDPRGAWPDRRPVAVVDDERRVGEERTTERRIYSSSLGGDAARFMAAVRTHWAIEHWLHWVA